MSNNLKSTSLWMALTLHLGAFQTLGAVTPFHDDLAGFDAAAATPPVMLNFDTIPANTDVSSQMIGGVTLTSVAAPLIVVRGSDTFTPAGFIPSGSACNRLFPTSGDNCLSPGGVVLGPGSNPTIEGDSIRLDFPHPVRAVGFDILEQLDDGGGFPVRVYDEQNNLIFSEELNTSRPGTGCGGSYFYGVVSTDLNIARLEIDELDSNNSNADSNVGYDTFRIQGCPPGIACPTISEWGVIAMGLLTLTAGTVVVMRRRVADVQTLLAA